GARDVLAAIDDEIAQAALGHPQPGKALCYEDQYISTGGQLYELMSGKDRFIADIRPLLEKVLKKRNQSPGLCCHPYDICTELIARELNVIITDAFGKPLSSPLDLHTNLSWVGYANHEIKKRLEPFVQHALRKYELM
ncbi:MAG: inositol monophosphatase, partial [bacterium]